MIRIFDEEVKLDHFPDGTLHLTPEVTEISWENNAIHISWYYENDGEMAALLFLTKHYQNLGYDVSLYLPYVPNARMDRVKDDDDVFTLKYFAEFINFLKFRKVVILDPHSNVTAALIDRVKVIDPKQLIEKAIASIKQTTNDELTMFFPDEGAMKRYSDMIGLPYAFGVKRRDWKTGKILGLEVPCDVDRIKGKTILIIDDICCKGGTFYHSAKKLKELGAGKIYLYVTHCESTVFRGELLHEDLIEKLYTTNSIFTKQTQKYAHDIGIMPNNIEVFTV